MIPICISRAITPEGVVLVFLAGQTISVYRRDPTENEFQAIPSECYRPERLPAATEIKAVTV